MGQLLACMINRPDLLSAALRDEAPYLGKPSVGKADGWGVGFYQAGEVLHKKRPQHLEEELEWWSMLNSIRSHIAVAHVRTATIGDRRAANTHPFRMRQWLFAHTGSVGGFDAIRAKLTASLPDFLQRNIRGDTDSEHIFHVLLSFLHDAGQLEVTDVAHEVVFGAVRNTLALLDGMTAEVGAPPAEINLVLTNGRQLYALRRGAPLMFVERRGLPSGEVPGQSVRPTEPVRYTMITSASNEQVGHGYKVLANKHVLAVDRDLIVTTHAL
jgi:predicted glutamine amidotransferase